MKNGGEVKYKKTISSKMVTIWKSPRKWGNKNEKQRIYKNIKSGTNKF